MTVVLLLAIIVLTATLAGVASAAAINGSSKNAVWAQIIKDVPAFATADAKSAFNEVMTPGTPAHSNYLLLVDTNNDTQRRALDKNYMLAYSRKSTADAAIQTMISFFSGKVVFPRTK